MSDQNLDYSAIRRSVEKTVAQQKWTYRFIFFGFHLVFYLVTMLVMWGTIAANSQLRSALFDNGFGASIVVLLPTILWSFIMLCHGAALFIESPVAEKNIRERVIMRELGEEILRHGVGMAEKPKRRAALELERLLLSDDGEYTDDQTPPQQATNRTNHHGNS